MLTTTIEEINGKHYTVVWDEMFTEDCRAEIGDWSCVEWIMCPNGCLVLHDLGSYIGTALPALPRKPTAEDVLLLYRYASEGLIPSCMSDDGLEILWLGAPFAMHYGITNNNERDVRGWILPEITHALDAQGNRHEIALEG